MSHPAGLRKGVDFRCLRRVQRVKDAERPAVIDPLLEKTELCAFG